MEEIIYRPIGVVNSPHKDPRGTPIQPTAAKGIKGRVEIHPEFLDGLQDLDGFSYIMLIYHFDRIRESKLKVKPFLDKKSRGVFATRAPVRPNPIGLSIVKLVKIQGNCLHIEDVDILDGTPILDLKPYVDRFDHRVSKCQGWLEANIVGLEGRKDDGRFLSGVETDSGNNFGD